MISRQVTVYVVVPEAISEERAISCLTADEQERASRFRFAKDAIHWRSCRAQLRTILAQETGLKPHEVPLIQSEFGKPLLAPPYAGLHFNLSHIHELALIALSSDGPVGIDLEKKSRGTELLGCEFTFCHPLEIENLPSDPQLRSIRLLQIWTHKEAVLKALGTGLSHPPEQVQVLFDLPVRTAISTPPIAGITDLRLQDLTHPMLDDYQAVVSMQTTTKSVNMIPFTL
jgi:4'-phosphopantetheinyl transferase